MAPVTLSAAEIIAIGEAGMAPRFSCGHPRIAENMEATVGSPVVRCRICAERAARLAPGAQA